MMNQLYVAGLYISLNYGHIKAHYILLDQSTTVGKTTARTAVSTHLILCPNYKNDTSEGWQLYFI